MGSHARRPCTIGKNLRPSIRFQPRKRRAEKCFTAVDLNFLGGKKAVRKISRYIFKENERIKIVALAASKSLVKGVFSQRLVANPVVPK